MTDQNTPTHDDLLKALTLTLASKPLPKNRLSEIAKAMSEARFPIIDYDICTLGMCIEHRYDSGLPDFDLSDFMDDRLGKIRKIEIFPEGILIQNQSRLRVTHSL
ncbi:hypothetical protein [Pseudosulfitobacter sp. SM2401]|jgi:hypothetical protein|uniref:hypothetical protein n=1 Tax=Pseudosulfitobacter sp. SM2401 TaxID=3350098 RepID=UPI0036F1E35E